MKKIRGRLKITLVKVAKTGMWIKVDNVFGYDRMTEKNTGSWPWTVCGGSLVNLKSFGTKAILLLHSWIPLCSKAAFY